MVEESNKSKNSIDAAYLCYIFFYYWLNLQVSNFYLYVYRKLEESPSLKTKGYKMKNCWLKCLKIYAILGKIIGVLQVVSYPRVLCMRVFVRVMVPMISMMIVNRKRLHLAVSKGRDHKC